MHTICHCPCLENFGLRRNLTCGMFGKFCTSCGEAPFVDVIILGGAAIINMLKPIGVKLFQEYATHPFLPFIKAQLRNVTRIENVWDMCLEDSLKSTAREIRGRGIRRPVVPSKIIPDNWQEFFRLADNKIELHVFDFLAYRVVEKTFLETMPSTQHVVRMCSRVHQDISSLAPCTHEEADTRMLLHAVDSSNFNKGYRRIMLRTPILAVSTVVCLEDTEIWVAFGTVKHLRCIPAHDIVKELGYEKARLLPMFHAFTGCDTVSSFAGRGKNCVRLMEVCVGTGTRPFSSYSISRHIGLRLAKECDTSLATILDTAARSGDLML